MGKILLLAVGALLGASLRGAGGQTTFEFTMGPVLENAFSPDCSDLVAARRYLYLVNDEMQGPTVEVNEGDTVTIRVTNNQPNQAVTLHWHGIHQMGTPYSDGVAYVTQCPLGAFQEQEFEFVAYPPGTHFWHAHNSMQMADGLAGLFIVHPKDPEPFTYDEERLLFLQDFYHVSGDVQRVGLDSFPFVWVGNPHSMLINGKGVTSTCEGADSDTPGCLDTCSDTLSLLEQIQVEEGKTYRIRIVNSASLIMFNVAIQGHNFTVVEAEGTHLEPFETDNLDISPGQRYSILLTADQPAGSYLIETTARERNVDAVGRAVLVYSGTDPELPTERPDHPEWNDAEAGPELEAKLKTLDPENYATASVLQAEVDRRFVMVGTQAEVVDESSGEAVLLRWAVNNISNIPEPEPLIGKAYEDATTLGWPTDLHGTTELSAVPPVAWNYTGLVDASEGGPGRVLGSQEPLILRFEEGEVVELVLQNARALNGVAEFHPWHLHGHSFWVVGHGQGTYDPEVDVPNYNLVNPVRRDTVTLWPLEWVALRFEANNPGVWEFHCHLLSHAVMGMGLSVVVQPDAVDAPPESVTSCMDHSLQSVDSDDEGDSPTVAPSVGEPTASPNPTGLSDPTAGPTGSTSFGANDAAPGMMGLGLAALGWLLA
uniref:Laccase n=1 Tax=Grammatophora oceanica TaxID=210454 RepID=A0A7S1UUP5_9STRA|mmetsp:Transcript_24312/g.35766  ORF Transcript_24312/g.35766 Transcript_24312/m.35766 type:complete len:655 (+) Transcript_24312:204-2168(+)|eukprot:CAMPEP_0194034442 /NCGR_PEP_ID=MMETSP0009_2-20130614/6863_1 /TAXON_ID=210454 /ORGANISM="Grammatophora oceanica, Strain CCMP 410" /LENGTH=654 /DNA_ID=CAMNT_0038675375 /DNA_START=203 /DNA_END=2167 /DNA_ORIENTATION=+